MPREHLPTTAAKASQPEARAASTPEPHAVRAEWQALVERTPDGFFEVDRAGIIVFSNRNGVAADGSELPESPRAPTNGAGVSWLTFVAPTDRARARAALDAVLESGISVTVEVDGVGRTGAAPRMSNHLTPIERAEGIVGAIVIARELTAPRQSGFMRVSGRPVAEGATATPGRRGCVLVVDEEPLVTRVLQRILSKGLEVVTVASCRDALESIARGQVFDVILCDLLACEMSGIELYEQLLAESPEHAKRIVFLRSGPLTERSREFLARNANARLEQPFEPARLRALVTTMVGCAE